MATQRDRVLAALRAEGRHGLDRTQFLAPNVYDGGKPIVNLPARIQELEELGCEIATPSRRHECVVYVLVSEPASDGRRALAPVRQAPEVLSNGAERIFNCRSCWGSFAHPSHACGRGRLMAAQVSPGNYVLGCQRVEVKAQPQHEEVRRAA